MAVQNWTSLAVYVGGYNIACRAKSFNAPLVSVAELDTTALCDTWEQRIAGLKSTSWDAEVMQDFDANQVDALVGSSSLGVAVPLSIAPAGSTAGSLAYSFNATQFSYTPLSAQVGELAMASLSGMGEGSPVIRGTLMNAPATAVTASGNTAGQELGAVSASQRLYAALHVFSASGTSPTLAVKVQSDDNGSFSSATDRITFTTATGITSQWSSVAGAITDTHWRGNLVIGGSATPTFTYALVLGITAA